VYLEGDPLTAAVKIPPKLKYFIWAATVGIWIAEALAAREPLNADAVSYLNMADSYLRGGWHGLVNGYWSPAYPFLLALVLKVFRPSPFHHSLAVHLFAVFSLLVALVSFEYLLSVFFAYREQFSEEPCEAGGEAISDEAVWLMGYALFFWITTFLTPPYLEQPDILAFILYLLACALCMQLSYRQEWWRYALLGLVLGLSYLTKAVMFPLGFVFLFALFLQKFQWRVFPRLVLSTAVVVAVSFPLCLALTQSKGRFTFGDAGTVNYRHIMGFEGQGLPPTVIPRPLATPHIQEYSDILQSGTYPPWADPSHNFKGAPFQFNFWRQINRTHVVLRDYFNIYVEKLGVLDCGLLVLIFWGGARLFARRFRQHVVLWFPAIVGLALYGTMRVEWRFLAGFTIALFAACIASIRITDLPNNAKLTGVVALAVSSLLFAQAGVEAGHEAIRLFGHTQHPDWQVATTLHQMGIGAGDRASYMGYGLADHGWAYVAGVKIVSEVPTEDTLSFWAANHERRDEVLDWLASTGAKVFVTRDVPSTAMPMGWRKAGDTDYYMISLPELRQTK
jgi:4-amino-4-deoxy-L-arabinose transferase-like glycosyltransferase